MEDIKQLMLGVLNFLKGNMEFPRNSLQQFLKLSEVVWGEGDAATTSLSEDEERNLVGFGDFTGIGLRLPLYHWSECLLEVSLKGEAGEDSLADQAGSEGKFWDQGPQYSQ